MSKKSDLAKLKQEISNDLMEMKQDTQKEKKLDKLDNLLLFGSSLMGYIFVIVQFIFGKTAIVLLFVPLLIFGVVIPFHTGYIKGAFQQSPINRARGWIYFFFGLGIYFWFTISFGILIFLNMQSLSGSLFFLALFSAILAGCYHFATFVSKKYGYKITKKDVEKLSLFIISAVAYLALSLIGYFGYLVYELYQIDPLTLGFLIPHAVLLIFISGLGCGIIFLTLLKNK